MPVPDKNRWWILALGWFVGASGCAEQVPGPPGLTGIEPPLVQVGFRYSYQVFGAHFRDRLIRHTEGDRTLSLDQEYAVWVRPNGSLESELGTILGTTRKKDDQTLEVTGEPLAEMGNYNLRVDGPYGRSDWLSPALEVVGAADCAAGVPAPLSSRQAGVCGGQVKVCKPGVGWVDPDYAVIAGYEPDETICDVLDNDCDDSVDEICAGIQWVALQGGSYQMGADDRASNQRPMHPVTVPGFSLLKTEVTVEQYQLCARTGKCSDPKTGGSCTFGVSGKPRHPVNCVTWDQAVAFCKWVGGRVPSEAEWEYAARGEGQNIPYPWGDTPPTCDHAVMSDPNVTGPVCGTSDPGPLPVCSRTAGNTAQGLCDMAGNVWEWVQDWFHSSYDGAPPDGSAWETPPGAIRVSRGASWLFDRDFMYTTLRSSGNPQAQSMDRGFRCARSP